MGITYKSSCFKSVIAVLTILTCTHALALQVCTTEPVVPTADDFKGVSGSSDSNVIAVAKGGDIYQYDGSTWSAMTSPTTVDLEDVEVVDANTAFAVGKRNGGDATVLSYNGTTWSSIDIVGVNEDLNGVWAASSTEVYVVGKKGTLYSHDGGTWTDESGNADAGNGTTGDDLEDAWGNSSTFYALSKNGDIYPYDRSGGTWPAKITACNIDGGNDVKFKDLWGDASGNLYLAGEDKRAAPDGTVYKYDIGAGTCTEMIAVSEKMDGIYGSTATGEIYAVGKKGTVAYFNGTTWQETTEGTEDFKDVWLSSSGNAYYAGKNGQTSSCTFTVDTSSCTTTTISGTPDFQGISGSSDSNIIGVAKGGEIYQYDGNSWNDMEPSGNTTIVDLEDVEVVDASTAFAVGKKDGGNATVLSYNGTSWSSINITGVGQDLKGVWAASSTEAYVVGKNGTLYSYNGSTWTDESGNADAGNGTTGDDLEDAWGNSSTFYALSKNGDIYPYDRSGGTWPAKITACNIDGGNDVKFKDLWGDAAGNLYLAGEDKRAAPDGTVYKYDIGAGTCTEVIAVSEKMDGIYGSTATGEIYAGGKNGVIAYFDGSSWTEGKEGSNDIRDVWVSDAGTPYYAAKGGTLVTCRSLIDHYAISYPNGTPGVTCETTAVRITGHDTDEFAALPLSGTTITLSTSLAADSWAFKVGSNPGSFSNLGGGSAEYTFDGTETYVDMWLTETTATTAPHIDIDVIDGNSKTDQDGVAEDDNAQFVDAIFRVADSTPAVVSINSPQIAGKDSDIAPNNQTLFVQAIRTDTATGSCVGIFQSQNDVTVEMAGECNDPGTCEAGSGGPGTAVQVENDTPAFQAIGVNDAGLGNDNYVNVQLDFDADSKAPLTFRYADAGQITLHFRKTLTAGSGTPPSTADTLTGSSNAFVVRPFALYVDDIKRTSDSFANPAATNATGTIFVKAGDGATSESQFSARVSAVVWESADDADNDGIPDTGSNLSANVATPNFGNESTAETVTMSHTLVDPAGGTAGSMSNGLYNSFTNGVQTVANLAWNEVGIISLTAAITDGNYLGIGSLPSYAAQNTVGRFYPDHFNVTDNTSDFADSCTSFTYMGQAFYYNTAPALDIEARATTGTTTNNYDRGYNKAFTLGRSAVHGGAAVNATFSTSSGGAITTSGTGDGNGTITLTLTSGSTGDSFLYDRVTTLQAQFNVDVDLTFASGGLTDTDSVCYDLGNNNSCDAYTITAIGNTEQRFGRFVLDNAFGSELINLPVSFRAEYYYDDGTNTSFATNTNDACTAFTLVDHLRLSNVQTAGGALQTGYTAMTIDSGSSSISSFNSPLSSGDAGVVFSAPGAGNTGVITIEGNIDCSEGTIACVSTDTFPYLLYDWDGDGTHDNNPEANITFGIYSRSKKIIYSREPW